MPEPSDVTAHATPGFLAMAPDRRGRVAAGLRCGLYLVVVAILAGLALVVLQSLFHVHPDPNVMPPLPLLLLSQGVIALTTVLVPTALMIAITRDRPTAFGWGTGDRMRNLAIGIVSGVAVMALLMGLIAALHGADVRLAVAPAGAMIRDGLGDLVVFALVAISEEGLLRGFALVALSRAISFWPAAIASSIVFALLHASHGGETVSGIVHVSLTGLLLAYSLWRSGSLWFAWGWHAAWDFSETFLFGTPDSGMQARDSLLVTKLHGAAWVTGGSAGPEGSWLVVPILGLVAVLVHLALRRSPPEAHRRAGAVSGAVAP